MIFENPPLRDANVPGPFSQIAAQEFNNNFISGMKYCLECIEKELTKDVQSYREEKFFSKVEKTLKKAKKELYYENEY